ncbi:MAG TPA: oligoendopeptidase F [Candidatus Ozemobacteraceae bacterium]|nr:oligoendopeptidase F [Candidatus Ozemobacteraceae bacterium]
MKKHLAYFFLPLLAVNVLAGSALEATERSEVPEKMKWNTADLYPTDDAWAVKAKDIAARIPKMADFQGKMGKDAASFYTALDTIMGLDRDLVQLMTYASMRSDEDTREAKPREMEQTSSDLAVKFTSAISFMRPEILAIGAEKVMGFVAAESKLAPYKPWLEDILRYAPHTLSPAEEKVAAQASLMSDAPGSAYSIFTNADMPYPETVLSDGKRVRLDASAYTNYRAAANRDDRMKVFRTFWKSYKKFERTLGTTLSGHVKTHLFNKEIRKYNSCLEAALFDANVPVAVYKQLIADVHANLPTLHRYLKLRKRIMNVERLGYEDLYAPIVKEVELKYTPEEAMALVLEAVAPLGEEYVAAVKTGYDNRWIDFIPTTGKKSGAYSTGAYGVHPYQLQNFTGLYDEVSTLAHEYGHSIHTYLSDKNQPYATHDYKTFVAEVASTLNENLLLHLMLKKTTDKATRLFLLGSYLDGLRTTLFRQTLFAEFEMTIHDLAEKGEPLTGEKLTEMYLKLLKEYYGHEKGVCHIDDLYGIEWAYIPHFYYNFYVYQYATSITASSLIASNMRSEATAATAREAYLKMLSSGSAKYPIDLLKDAGVDMTTSQPFNAAIKEMNTVMDEMEKLLGEK